MVHYKVLVLGQRGCGKTTFVQNLAKNKMLDDNKKAGWISKIHLSKERDEDIKTCLVGVNVEFHYPEDNAEFNLLLEKHQDENIVNKEKFNDDIFGEKREFDRLIVMEDVSGLANVSNEFGNFLTVSRKFGYIFVYFFHILFPSKSN